MFDFFSRSGLRTTEGRAVGLEPWSICDFRKASTIPPFYKLEVIVLEKLALFAKLFLFPIAFQLF